jgi:ribosome-associated translation inhibitor RaiA
MTLQRTIETRRCALNAAEQGRIDRQLGILERRLVNYAEPVATLILEEHEAQRRVTADLRLELGHRAATLISHQSAETADVAVRLAVDDIARQLERRLAKQRGQPTYGVPSRREPEALRPHPIDGERRGGGAI